MIGRLDEVVIDCDDTMMLARFWQGVLGGDIVRQSAEWVAIHRAGAVTVSFQHVPEPKVGKNRLHLDVDVDDLDHAAESAIALGARRIGQVVLDALGGFQVMADPEGNEFCFVNGPTPEQDDELVA
jgi:predicted enzyme related to lactoylglutathione lyase